MRSLDLGWTTCTALPGCTGSARQPYGRCLAHLDDAELTGVLGGLSPGSPVDLRGTRVEPHLLERILDATRGRPGRTRFDRAVLTGDARFGGVVFGGDATFDHARFHHLASFVDARFTGNVSFRGAGFTRELSLHGVSVAGHAAFDRVLAGRDALFGAAAFGRTVSFEGAELHGFTSFDGARFAGDAVFRGCRFGRAVSFRRAEFGGLAGFEGARFREGGSLTPASAGRGLSLAGAWAGGGLDVAVAGCRVDLRRLRAAGRLAVRLDGAEADLTGATLLGPARIEGRVRSGGNPGRDGNGGRGATARRTVAGYGAARVASPRGPDRTRSPRTPLTSRVTSLRGLDAEALELVRVDLGAGGLTGVHRPERLRLTGCAPAAAPRGVRLATRRWPRRRALTSGPALGALGMRRVTVAAPARWLLGPRWAPGGNGPRMNRIMGWLALVTAVTAASLLAGSASHAAHRPVPAPPQKDLPGHSRVTPDAHPRI
ncbi:pentapeptide repeat-containing protein [Streptosporangium sandarakinum]